MWVPGTTNLVSIRDVFFCPNPYLKCYANVREELSLLYNEITVNFENLVVGHFRSRVRANLVLLSSCQLQAIPNDDRPNSIQDLDVNVENMAEKSAPVMSQDVNEPAQRDANSTNEDFAESSHEHLKAPMNVNLKKRGWSLASISSSIVEKFKLRRVHM